MKWLVLGANSGIARAVLARALQPGDEAVLLCRRRESVADLLASAAERRLTLDWRPGDALDDGHLEALLREMEEAAWIPDRVLLAWGVLRREPAPAEALALVERVNGEASLGWLDAVLQRIADDRARLAGLRRVPSGPVRVLVLGSVAGDRIRPSLAAYGRSKRLLERGVDALRAGLAGLEPPVTLTLAKPGPVRTPMLSAGGWARKIGAEPEAVAPRLLAAMEAGRPVVYAPAYWRAVMAVLRALPGDGD